MTLCCMEASRPSPASLTADTLEQPPAMLYRSMAAFATTSKLGNSLPAPCAPASVSGSPCSLQACSRLAAVSQRKDSRSH